VSYALTLKQETFCTEYIKCGNASEAYRAAYHTQNMKPETVHRSAKELMDNPKVAARLAGLRAKVEEGALAVAVHEKVSADRVLAELWDNAMKAKAAEPVTTRDGTAIGVYQANWAASTKAIELYGRQEHGMFVEKKEIKVNQMETLTDDEIDRRIQENAEKANYEVSPRRTLQ
jgi:phage terminase small subunit